MTTGLQPRRSVPLRAPKTSGSSLVEPPWEAVGALVADTQSDRRQACYDLQGRCLSEVSRQARCHLIAEARRWTASYRDIPPPPDDLASATIFLAGHQPQLFHPGVWFKNFAVGTLARRHGAVAVNLLIDTDTFKHNALPVPGGSRTHPERHLIAMDLADRPIPFEERRILDRRRFAEFGRRVADRLAPLVPDPLLRDWWPMVVQRSTETANLGACLAQARHQLEGRWGLSTLELPESAVCSSEPFAWFTAHLLAQLPRFRSAYNEAVAEYRRRSRIRSAAHPVPDLAADGPWLEAPFWIWTADNPSRRRLFARQVGQRIELSDRRGLELSLRLSPDAQADRAVDQLAEYARQGVKIRARALITTLWARMALGDLFVHGIGGAKYDRVTDVLIERFFGLRPPGFLVVSATLHLPVDAPRTTEEDARLIRHRLRELTYHPERYLDQGTVDRLDDLDGLEAPAALVAAKRRWIAAEPTPRNARRRFLEIRRINQALQPWVARQREHLLAEGQRVDRALAARSILHWREHAFCLYPEKTLRDFLCGLLPKSV